MPAVLEKWQPRTQCSQPLIEIPYNLLLAKRHSQSNREQKSIANNCVEYPPTIRVGAYRNLPGPRPCEFPGALSTGRGDEPLPLRLHGRAQRALSVYTGADPALSQQALRAVAGPD